MGSSPRCTPAPPPPCAAGPSCAAPCCAARSAGSCSCTAHGRRGSATAARTPAAAGATTQWMWCVAKELRGGIKKQRQTDSAGQNDTDEWRPCWSWRQRNSFLPILLSWGAQWRMTRPAYTQPCTTQPQPGALNTPLSVCAALPPYPRSASPSPSPCAHCTLPNVRSPLPSALCPLPPAPCLRAVAPCPAPMLPPAR